MPREAEKEEEEQRCQINIRSVAGPSYQIFMLNDSGMRLHAWHLAPWVGECRIFGCKEVAGCAVLTLSCWDALSTAVCDSFAPLLTTVCAVSDADGVTLNARASFYLLALLVSSLFSP